MSDSLMKLSIAIAARGNLAIFFIMEVEKIILHKKNIFFLQTPSAVRKAHTAQQLISCILLLQPEKLIHQGNIFIAYSFCIQKS